jgi:hypothetical protein
MSKVYVLFTRKYPKEDSYVYLPNYEIYYEQPEAKGPRDKVAVLEVGDAVDTMRCTLSEDETYVNCELITVGNIDGKAEETLTETFILAREA